MVDDVRDITETAESKASAEALDRARLARERREAEQRKRLDELRAHAAAAQAQREKRDEERRRRQAEQRARDDDRRLQVEERKRAIWEASISRREALLQRERDRSERLERARASRSSPRSAFAFGSSTPRLLEPVDSAGFFWAARSTNPIDQMNFFESLAASTTNVMFASAPLTRRASALQLDSSDTEHKDEPDRQQAAAWSSVARRRTDLVPTVPAARAPEARSGESTPGSRPASALSSTVVRRAPAARRARPASIAGTGVNTPRVFEKEVPGWLGRMEGMENGAGGSLATTPSVSRDSTVVSRDCTVVSRDCAPADVRRATPPRRPRPLSMHAKPVTSTPVAPGEGKPPLHRKPKPSKEHDKTPRGKSLSASPGRALSPPRVKDPGDRHKTGGPGGTRRLVDVHAVSQKLEALQLSDHADHTPHLLDQLNENKENIVTKPEVEHMQVDIKSEVKQQDNLEVKQQYKPEVKQQDKPEVKQQEKPEVKQQDKPEANPLEQKETKKEERREENEKKEDRKEKESSLEKSDDSEMTASMTARRITTEEEAKAALAERRRRAREELERNAELERQRLQREAEEEAERQRIEEERQRREEEEARELARYQREEQEMKLRKAIEAQEQLQREEAERRQREEAERRERARADEERRAASERAERARRDDAEREERERLARKQRVEAIMARTRLRKAEEEKKLQESKAQSQTANESASEANAAESQHPASETHQPEKDAHQTEKEADQSKTETQNTDSDSLQNSTNPFAPAPSEQNAVSTESMESQVATTESQIAASESQAPSLLDNGNSITTGDLLGFTTSQSVHLTKVESTEAQTQNNSSPEAKSETSNGNVTADLLGLSQNIEIEDKPEEQIKPSIDNVPTMEPNNGNVGHIGHISANFIQTERISNENQKIDLPKLLEDDFTSHNGHNNHPLTLQNAI